MKTRVKMIGGIFAVLISKNFARQLGLRPGLRRHSIDAQKPTAPTRCPIHPSTCGAH
jgi:hypothetical protein